MTDASPRRDLAAPAPARRGDGRVATAAGECLAPVAPAPAPPRSARPGRPGVVGRVPWGAAAWSNWRTDLRAALVPWLVSRVLVGVGAMTAVIAADRLIADRPVPLDQGLLAWDGAAYRDIAAHGYRSLPASGMRFFPLFPLVGRVVAFGSARFAGAGLVVVANVAALVALALLHRLVRLEFGPRHAALAPWLLALYPAAFVLVLGYSESLLLVAALACFLAIRQRRWGWAALAGALAAACRPLGVVLVVPVLIEASRNWRRADRHERVARVGAVLAPLAALAAYFAYAHSITGGWLTPLRAQDTFRGDFVEPLGRLARAVGDMFSFERLGDGLHAPFAVALVVLVVLAVRWLPLAYSAYSAAIVVLSLSAENLNSIERYGLNAFPLIIVVTMLANRFKLTQVVLTATAGVLVALTTLAYIGAYVP